MMMNKNHQWVNFENFISFVLGGFCFIIEGRDLGGAYCIWRELTAEFGADPVKL